MHPILPQVELDPSLLILAFIVLGTVWLVCGLSKAREIGGPTRSPSASKPVTR